MKREIRLVVDASRDHEEMEQDFQRLSFLEWMIKWNRRVVEEWWYKKGGSSEDEGDSRRPADQSQQYESADSSAKEKEGGKEANVG